MIVKEEKLFDKDELKARIKELNLEIHLEGELLGQLLEEEENYTRMHIEQES